MPLAVGVLGLSLADLDNISPGQLREAIIARYAYDQMLQRDGWEQMRMLGYFVTAPHVKKGTNLKPENMVKLPWDNGADNDRTRAQQIKDKIAASAEWIKRKNERDGIKSGG